MLNKIVIVISRYFKYNNPAKSSRIIILYVSIYIYIIYISIVPIHPERYLH